MRLVWPSRLTLMKILLFANRLLPFIGVGGLLYGAFLVPVNLLYLTLAPYTSSVAAGLDIRSLQHVRFHITIPRIGSGRLTLASQQCRPYFIFFAGEIGPKSFESRLRFLSGVIWINIMVSNRELGFKITRTQGQKSELSPARYPLHESIRNMGASSSRRHRSFLTPTCESGRRRLTSVARYNLVMHTELDRCFLRLSLEVPDFSDKCVLCFLSASNDLHQLLQSSRYQCL